MPVCVGDRESYFFQIETVVLGTESPIFPVSKSLPSEDVWVFWFLCFGFDLFFVGSFFGFFLWEGECELRFMKPLVSAYLEETCGQRQ